MDEAKRETRLSRSSSCGVGDVLVDKEQGFASAVIQAALLADGVNVNCASVVIIGSDGDETPSSLFVRVSEHAIRARLGHGGRIPAYRTRVERGQFEPHGSASIRQFPSTARVVLEGDLHF